MLFWYVFPVIVLFAGKFIVSSIPLLKRYKIKAPDFSIPFLFLGLNELSKDTYGKSILPYLILSILILGIITAIFQAFSYGELLYSRYFKTFWRLTFLFSLLFYSLFVLLNIIYYLS